MLSGIKVGKKKSKRPRVDVPNALQSQVSDPSNRDAAAALRAQISSGGPLSSLLRSDTEERNHERHPRQTGRITNQDEDNDNVVVLTGKAVMSSSRPEYQKEDFRSGARKGKVKRKAVDTIGTTHDEATMSIQDMLREEKEQDHSMDEIYARNVARMGSRFKGTELKAGSSAGADEEDFVDVKIFQQQNLTKVAVAQRESSRQLARHDRQSAIAAKCWWWMESPTFRKHMLIALGNHVSLVMAPSHLSLFPGNCFYIVPLQHADSLVRCDDDTWNEIHKFQTSLRTLFGREEKDVIFTETVLGTKAFWQTRLTATPIPRKQNDAPMYFKQAMLEQAEECGTHNKVLSTRGKGFRRTIPANFNYFHVEWDTNDGFAQIIETNDFPADFGVDTLAGMLQMDSVRFRRTQRQSFEEEKKMVLTFLEKWKTVDWTLELEG
ncbi:Protein similar to CwfJ C-terminus 2 [Fragilaria crotonensis]|nr:Protein similar to CwfJ C-terminus 2 [Fragilaria crotonensis]